MGRMKNFERKLVLSQERLRRLYYFRKVDSQFLKYFKEKSESGGL